MLKKIFGPKRNEITEEWRRLHNEELYMFSSPDVMWATRLRRMRWVRHVACVAERNLYRVLVGKPEGESPLGRPRQRRKDNNKISLKGTGCKTMDWIYVVQDRDNWQAFANAVINLWVPKNMEIFLTN